MPNINLAGRQPAGLRAQEQSLAQLVQRGALLPVIAGEALDDLVLGGHRPLVQGYADYVAYPLPDRDDLLKMVKFKSLQARLKDRLLKADYLDFVGTHLYSRSEQEGVDADLLAEAAAEAARLTVSEFAGRLGYPRFDRGSNDPLLILANLPLPIYLTSSPYTFVEEALRRAGKTPRSEFCRWHRGLDSIPSVFAPGTQGHDYLPGKNEPLVYHLYGIDAYPDSLVLTEDDFLALLIAVSQGQGKDLGVDPVHSVVRGALSSSALLLLGFSLASWAFRALYWGLIRPVPTNNERYCCVQLAPGEQERLYLDSYLRQEARFDEVFWGSCDDFVRERLGTIRA